MSEEELIEVTRELLNDAPRESSAPPTASNGRLVRTATRISAARLEAMQVVNKRFWWKKMTFESPDNPDTREELRVGQLLITTGETFLLSALLSQQATNTRSTIKTPREGRNEQLSCSPTLI